MRSLDRFAQAWRSALHECAASLSNAKTLQEHTLFDRSVNRHIARSPCKCAEIDMRRQIGAARVRECVGKSMVTDALKGFAKRGFRMTIVDEQSGAASRDPGGDAV